MLVVITGVVDDYGRPLAPVVVRHPTSGQFLELEAWIDTGFTGGLSVTPAQESTLSLPATQSMLATVADGSCVLMQSVRCEVVWFGKPREIDALISPGKFATLGLQFLQDHELK